MRIAKRGSPVDYSLCNQTVTVYHKESTGYTRKVYDRAFFEVKVSQTIGKTGQQEGRAFLLVIPGNIQTVFPGDKIIEGVGPVLETREAWAAFAPDNVSGAVVAKNAQACRWNGEIVHTEAGA